MINQDLGNMCITIRYAHRGDYQAIGDIEAESFIDPWLPEVIAWSVSRQHATAIVAEWQGEIVGYAVYLLEGQAELSYIKVHRLAVAESVRRCGVGGMLLDDIFGRLTIARETLVFPVRESNLVAQLWLKEYGIKCWYISHGYYAEGEDAYVFEIDMGDDFGD